MILVTHAVVGGAIGQVIGNPSLAFSAGFLSHFILDAIPHWDYPLGAKIGAALDVDMNISSKYFKHDIAKITLDILIGFIFVYIFQLSFWAAAGAIFPDFLQFAYFKLRWRPLRWLQSFHIWIHSDLRLDSRPVFGPLLQILLIIAVIAIISL
ncbi:hypothetical protein IT398_02895 [Candidatus Nomurabacteria bacterium]|nr:hypothetical protein [Candidatus Nomurabacteria bacterium]